MIQGAYDHFENNPKQFENLLADAEKKLYPGCSKFTKLSALVKLYNLKARNGWSYRRLSDLLKLLREMLPDNNEMPCSMYEAKKTLNALGMDYEKIHACPNDCILYRKGYKDAVICPNCGAARWKLKKNSTKMKIGVPTKVLWYFPPIPRFKRMFQSVETSKNLTWYATQRETDGLLRHPVDTPAWKLIDHLWLDFGAEPRNLRLALSVDGINPYNSLSSRYSCWPVIVVTYNLPPWLCMKRKFMMLTLLISGPKQPGNDIDVYLAPLIDDLKILWEVGIEAYDAYRQESFTLKAILMWTINDFPAYGNLAGCTKKAFNNEEEIEIAPKQLKGEEILAQVQRLNFSHTLDVMHIEKNVCESLVGTLLDIPGKSKDGFATRIDLDEMGVRKELPPRVGQNGTKLPPACYTLSREEKKKFCKTLFELKVPDGYCSNFKNLISWQDLKLYGLKSHDCHALMQQLLPLAIRSLLPKHVRYVITRFCAFFSNMYSKVVDVSKLDQMQADLVNTICLLEKYFSPAFFDIMIHLPVHLVREVKLCGPVYLRWMYPFERQMKILKDYVRNRDKPEGCIAESYIAEEVIEFCIEYLSEVDAIGIPPKNYRSNVGLPLLGGCVVKIDRKLWVQAHRYVLKNTNEVQPYIIEHMEFLKKKYLAKSKKKKWLQDELNRTFIYWLRQKVEIQLNESRNNISEALRWIAHGPRLEVIKYQGYEINGYRFRTKERDDLRVVQNSGVYLEANIFQISSAKDKNPMVANMLFYGVIQEIWELDYNKFKIHVFKCDWVENNHGIKNDELRATLVNLNRIGHKDDSFILASQPIQVFYAEGSSPGTYLQIW
ncbi:uncharacterized protein LOC127902216 [Citrus sinensis]|uniref:uncharacterized protein LOC127902216 n=1 Tax=Citrus sinensis TaxID=2711 RepID=UPI002277B56E|nr:uncharacterized protein LOC127902216 [Citrus sinensis]